MPKSSNFIRMLLGVSLMAAMSTSASGQSNESIWIGDLNKTSERGSVGGRYAQCNRSGMIAGQEIVFDSWDLSRAVVSNLCFRVYAAGMTDAGVSPGDLRVDIVYRPSTGPGATNDPGEQWTVYPANFIGWEGNNFVYSISAFDFVPSYGRALNGNTATAIDFQIRARSVSGTNAYGEIGPFRLKFNLE